MPIVEEGGGGARGSFMVEPYEIANDLIVRDGHDPQLRIKFRTVPGPGEESINVSMGVDLVNKDWAFERLQPCCPTLNRAQLEGADEAKMRELIKGNLTTEPRLAYVKSGYIQSFTAMPGTHRGKFKSMFLTTRKTDGVVRAAIVLRNNQGLESFWTMPWGPDAKGENAAVIAEVGDTAATDKIEIFASKAVFDALITLGFDMDLFMKRLRSADAFFPHIGLDGDGPEPMFQNHENITPELVAFMHEERDGYDGPRTVEWKVVQETGYPIGPERTGQYKKVELTPVVVDESEFQQELKLFLTRWDKLTRKVFEDQDLRFVVAGAVTDQGYELAKKVMVPVINAYPDVVKGKKADGSPSIKLPPKPDTWNLNGLVAMSDFASKLMKEEKFLDIINDQEQLIAWTNLEVDILQTDLAYVEETEVIEL